MKVSDGIEYVSAGPIRSVRVFVRLSGCELNYKYPQPLKCGRPGEVDGQIANPDDQLDGPITGVGTTIDKYKGHAVHKLDNEKSG